MNFSKKHISITASYELTEICKPLMECCSITFFEYTRNYYDNTHLYLSTHPQAAELMFNENHHLNAICFKHPEKYEFDYALWDTADSRYACFELGETIKEKYDVAHFLNYVVRNKNYTEVFSFAGSFFNTELNNIYQNQQQIFKHFSHYFWDKAELLLKAAEKQRLYIPYANSLIDILDDAFFENNKIQLNNFLAQTKINNIHLTGNFSGISLTNREALCIEPLLAGCSYKQIAKLLNISPRTVESRLEQLRYKLGCDRKQDLINTLSHDDIQRSLNHSNLIF